MPFISIKINEARPDTSKLGQLPLNQSEWIKSTACPQLNNVPLRKT